MSKDTGLMDLVSKLREEFLETFKDRSPVFTYFHWTDGTWLFHGIVDNEHIRDGPLLYGDADTLVVNDVVSPKTLRILADIYSLLKSKV